MTFAALLADVYRRLNYTSSPATDVATRIKAFVNESQQELAADPAIAPMLRGTASLTTVASTAAYGLPPNVTRLLSVRNSAHRRRLIAQTEDWWRAVAPEPSVVTGTPEYYIRLGYRAVAQQPSTADTLYAKSTSPGDVQVLYFEVRRTGGYVQTGTVTLTGTTAVQVTALTDVEEVIDWYLASAAAGQVTLLQTSGSGTELGRIGIQQTRSRYQWIAFYPTPSAAEVYSLEHEIDASDLVQDTDEPAWLPPRFHRLLAIGARVREYEQKDDDRYDAALKEWARGVALLKAYRSNPPDETIVPGRAGTGLSDLGAFFPAGTIWD